LTDTRGLVLKSSSRMKMFSAGRCWGNPLVWKDFHFLTGGYSMAIVKWFLYGGLLFAIILFQYYGDYRWRGGDIDWESAVGVFAMTLVAFLVIEASLYASRIFHDEIRLQTMSSLLMLPRSVAYLGYSKVLGCLLGLFPAAFWLLFCGVFALLAGWLTGPYVDPVTDLVLNPGLWGTLLTISFFLHLTTLLSLFVKWGALPLAILIMMMMTCTCPMIVGVAGMLIQSVNDDAGLIVATLVMMLINLVASFVLQMMIGARLQEIGSK